MFRLTDIIPRYLLGKHQLTASVVFAALFSLIFILVSIPFTQNAWFQLAGNEAFGYTVAFFVIAVIVVVISKRALFFRSANDMTYLEYMLWCFGEVCVIALLYTAFTIEGESFGIIETDNIKFVPLLAQSIIITLVCLGIPELKRQFAEDLDLVLGAVGIGELGQLLLGGVNGRASG